MVDSVYISELRIDAIIGIHPWERRIRQTLLVDLEMAVDSARVAETDTVDDTVDYAAVSGFITDFVIAGEFRLLETLADRLARALQDRFGLPWLRLRVGKPGAVPAARDVGVLIERGQPSDGRSQL